MNRRFTILLLLALSLIITGCAANGDNEIILGEESQTIIIGSDGRTPEIDLATNAFTTIDYAHHEVHEGDMFNYCGIVNLANGAIRNILIVTPNTTKISHLIWEIEHELETSVEFFEGTTYSNNGTAVTSYNKNRTSSSTAGTKVYHTPTITGDGTKLCITQTGSGKKSGGGDRSIDEWILKANTAYLIRITNKTTINNLISTKLTWYEHTSKE